MTLNRIQNPVRRAKFAPLSLEPMPPTVGRLYTFGNKVALMQPLRQPPGSPSCASHIPFGRLSAVEERSLLRILDKVEKA